MYSPSDSGSDGSLLNSQPVSPSDSHGSFLNSQPVSPVSSPDISDRYDDASSHQNQYDPLQMQQRETLQQRRLVFSDSSGVSPESELRGGVKKFKMVEVEKFDVEESFKYDLVFLAAFIPTFCLTLGKSLTKIVQIKEIICRCYDNRWKNMSYDLQKESKYKMCRENHWRTLS